jgi:4-amino-4-deoxy-L-arabinose transferase-like glycosyltransferase
MIEFIRQHRRLFVLLTLAGVALRLFFIMVFPITQGDTLVYADIAKNWLDHHTFAQTIDGQPEPTLIRLPGYPAFLAVCFKLFGRDHYGGVRILQLLMDLAACFLVADLVRRIVGERAAPWAFGIAVLCPFTANYAALPLAETPSIVLTVAAFWFAVRGMDTGRWREWVGCGVASGAAILMRPDNALVLVVVCGYVIVRGLLDSKSKIKNQKSKIRDAVLAVVLVGAVSLAPLVPWTIRNWRVFHVFQPLAARYANNPDEDPHLGFQQWTKTWMGEYVSVVEVYWHVTGEEVDAKLLPSRAFDSAEERTKTFELFTAYNEGGNTLPAELDARFGELARERKQRHPLRYYVWLPAARIADMWLRPRTEMIGIMERWWEYWTDPVDFTKALLCGLLNLAYVSVAVIGMVWQRREVRFAGMLITFVVLRSLFLGTLENPEPRYTLEMFPVLFVFAAPMIARVLQPKSPISGA